MNDKILREHLITLLSGRGAHIDLKNAVKDFPEELIGRRVENIPHTAWHLIYHMRIAQWDILEFSRNPEHLSPDYPHGYWPDEDSPENTKVWRNTISSFHKELEEMKALVGDPGINLFTPFPHGSGQTLLREALVLADHNSYHIGQLVDLRMLLGVPVRDW
jgi:hypothetical protein